MKPLFAILMTLAVALNLCAHPAAEEMVDAATRFLAALAPEQQNRAHFEFADAERENWHFIPRARLGLSIKEMTPAQHALARALLERIVKEFLYRVRPEIADDDWSAIRAAGFDKVSFAWAGGLEEGQGHYYRVQGPTFLLEMANTQNRANHVHSVWRDFEKDFGGDPLLQHYEHTPHDP